MSYLILRDNGEVGSLVAALQAFISVMSKLDDKSMNQVLKIGGELAEAVGDRPLFSNKADYLDHLRDLEKRLMAHSKSPLAELSKPQMEIVMEAVVQWQERTLRYDSRLLRKLTRLRDAATYDTPEGPPQ